jgi:N,N'-diacetyllegionaminate synthase
MRDRELILGERTIGGGAPVFVIADAGLDHGGDVSQVRRLIDAAVQSGADGIGVHAHRTERLVASGFAAGQPEVEASIQRLRGSELSADSHQRLVKYAESLGISYLPMPFDEETVDSLDQLGAHGYRVASCELTHIPLLRRVASKAKPVFLATGMSYLSEVADAVWALRSGGAAAIVLMHCVSNHPAPADSLNLRAIRTLREHFELPVGYTDHSEGALFPLVAATLGAVAVEKTLALDLKAAVGPQLTGIGPDAMRGMIQGLRALELCLGDGRKRPAACEELNRARDRRSVVAACDIRAYETIAPWMLTCKRPGSGIEPGRIDRLIGMLARRNISKETVLRWEDLVAAAGREPERTEVLFEGSPGSQESFPMELQDDGTGGAGLDAAIATALGGRRRL